MSEQDSTDGRFGARLHDLIHRGNPGDLAFYREACAGSRSVLELGCGTGRVLRHLVEAGLEVTGIDLDRDRLEKARERLDGLDPAVAARARLFHADMRSFDLHRTFDRVLAPYNVLYTLLDDRALDDCLRGVARHLDSDGRFVFDGYVLESEHAPDDDAAARPPTPLVTVQDGDATVRVFEQARWMLGIRRVDVTYTFHVHVPGRGVRVVRQVERHRWIPPSNLEEPLARAGMRLLAAPAQRGEPGARWYGAVAVHVPQS